MILTGIFLWYLGLKTAQAIDCFKCISMNKDYPPCEDPFHNNFTMDIYESPCMGGRKGRDGVFPATSCVKITGTFEDNEETIMIRGCALDSGTLTTDTELVRMSHCGAFYYDNRYVHGCVQTCNDADACNNSFKIRSNIETTLILTIAVSSALAIY
ncbi:uncharacterized protein LOC123676255 isoform X1 [Harmonia axyridis]|uniref:uncharacterized protein LOC123676255 isoform X1 n=2 Tax=Harmonia axyridis TaxID=115357 RepID=UPI001E276840|nr:uncharacterized protein LOC123676255 isoform X1 [Harmonia axyridis]